MRALQSNKKNRVFDSGENIIKHFSNKLDYNNEKSVYQKLNYTNYLAKLISFDDQKMTIELEKLTNKLRSLGYIPSDFAKVYYEVSKGLYAIGCSYVADISKVEHWFYIEDNGFIQLKVIDFDAVDISERPQNVIDYQLSYLKNEFNFLNDRNDKNSFNSFRQRLYRMGYTTDQVDEFEKKYTMA